MDFTEKLKPGMRVVGPDRTEYGTVERYDATAVYVEGRPIPYAAFERVDQDRLYVGNGGVRHLQAHRPTDRAAQTVAPEGELRVPLLAERLAVSTRTVELGDVEIRKTVESEDVSVPIELRRDRVGVRQVDVEERPLAIGEGLDAFEQDLIRVPVRGEEVLASKQAVVTGEVAVGREELHERHTVTETLRQEAVDLSVSHNETSPELREHVDRLRERVNDDGGRTVRARDFTDGDVTARVDAHPRHTGPDGREAVPSGAAAGAAAPDGDVLLRVPEVEEHLRVERRRIALGFVEIRKTVVTEQVMVPVAVRREVVEYRMIDDPGGVATIGEKSGDLRDDTIRIPVFRERPVVKTETVVVSEVLIDRSLIVERQTIDETLRRTRVTVEDNTAPWAPVARAPGHDGPLRADHGGAASADDRLTSTTREDDPTTRLRGVRQRR